MLFQECREGESVPRETSSVAERLEGRSEFKGCRGPFLCFLFHEFCECTIADTGRQLNKCEEIPHFLQGEESNLLESEFFLHLLVQILDVPTEEVDVDDLLLLPNHI